MTFKKGMFSRVPCCRDPTQGKQEHASDLVLQEPLGDLGKNCFQWTELDRNENSVNQGGGTEGEGKQTALRNTER